MRVVNLVENTTGHEACAAKHGLSFYVETGQRKLLIDAGPSRVLLDNAKELNVDLSKVELVVLSHGHYDHGGGLLPFFEVNQKARVYMQDTAGGDYYSLSDAVDGPRYIGLDRRILESGRVELVSGDRQLGDNFWLFSNLSGDWEIPLTNKMLKKSLRDSVKTERLMDIKGNCIPMPPEEGELVQDDFGHEQCLLIEEKKKTFLFSGCAHNGILNIMGGCCRRRGSYPDVVFSGFHMLNRNGYSQEEYDIITKTARELAKYPTVYYTCHCTGLEPYERMKEILGDQLHYVHCGDSVML